MMGYPETPQAQCFPILVIRTDMMAVLLESVQELSCFVGYTVLKFNATEDDLKMVNWVLEHR